ncbi:MAG: NAD(P)-dependent oxidoreductase [Roseivivax sp.]|nr:NAD(P)-dependent oxidoreductase [Roseivivax sp.]
MTMPKQVAIIGFGEAGGAFAAGWGANRPAVIAAYDRKTDAPASRAVMEARYGQHGVTGAGTAAVAVAGAAAVFSTVTADQAPVAAREAAAGLAPGTLWFDCNSCAPDTKRAAAAVIDTTGGRYVDVAVMAPVHPKRHLVPLLVSGPHAEAGAAVLRALGMRPEVVPGSVGAASSIKMIRSVMIKGMEALMAECLLSARRAGVEEAVLASLEASDPDIRWRDRGTYALDRMMMHGGRRAAEMREVAKTVAALGLSDAMSAGSAHWQDTVARAGCTPGEPDLMQRLDRLLDAL